MSPKKQVVRKHLALKLGDDSHERCSNRSYFYSSICLSVYGKWFGSFIRGFLVLFLSLAQVLEMRISALCLTQIPCCSSVHSSSKPVDPFGDTQMREAIQNDERCGNVN